MLSSATAAGEETCGAAGGETFFTGATLGGALSAANGLAVAGSAITTGAAIANAAETGIVLFEGFSPENQSRIVSINGMITVPNRGASRFQAFGRDLLSNARH